MCIVFFCEHCGVLKSEPMRIRQKFRILYPVFRIRIRIEFGQLYLVRDPGEQKWLTKRDKSADILTVLRIRIRIRIHRIHVFLGLPDPDPLVRGMDPDPDPALDPDPSIIMQK